MSDNFIGEIRIFSFPWAPQGWALCNGATMQIQQNQALETTANLRPEQVDIGRKASLLGKAADKDDCADQVVTMCRTNTMTGQTIVIDSGRTFH